MPIPFLDVIDLNGNEIIRFKVHMLATDPTGGDLADGILWLNTATNTLKFRSNGTIYPLGTAGGGVLSFTVDNASIENIGTASDPSVRVKALGITNAMLAGSIAIAKLATDPLARANHTGTQTAATISDLATVVQAYRLDQFAAPNTSLSMGSQRVINVADPSAAQDAATKAYVDSVAAGLAPKDAVRAASTATVVLASAVENGDVLDGVTLATGDRILLKNQTAPAENGIYTVNATGAPTRATDADSSGDLVGAAVFVSEGTVNGNTLWVMTTDAPITVGTTGLVWAQFGGPGAYTAGTGLTLTGTQFALTSPVTVATGGTGATDATTARTNLGATTKLAFNVGGSTAQTLTHNFNTRDVDVIVYRNSTPWDRIHCGIEHDTVNSVILRFTTAPAANAFRAVIFS